VKRKRRVTFAQTEVQVQSELKNPFNNSSIVLLDIVIDINYNRVF
jgi:hypothetical protein